MIYWFRYARHADVPNLEACGWLVASDLGPVHGAYSVLMRWYGEGAPSALSPAAE